MKNTIVIDIGGQMLQMTLLVPEPQGHVLARLVKRLMGNQELKKADTVQLIGEVNASKVGARMAQAMEAIGKRSAQSLKSCEVRVRLGADFARVAVMDSPEGIGKHHNPNLLDQQVQSWIKWKWGAATPGVVRHAPLDERFLLVSVVDQNMLEAVERACQDKQIRLVECRPAILSVLEDLPSQPEATEFHVLAVEEVCEDKLASLVQFITQRSSQTLSVHRMWMPNQSNDSMQGVAQRLRAHHMQTQAHDVPWPADTQGPVPIRRVQWPTSQDGRSRG